MARADFRFAYPRRARYAEIDAQAVVFNARYLEYFDIGITEYWRAAGLYAAEEAHGKAEFHVARALVEYKRPILLDELFDICIRCDRIGTTSMTFLFELHGAGVEDLRATGEEVSVHVGQVAGRPTPLPAWIVDLFEVYEGRVLQPRKAA